MADPLFFDKRDSLTAQQAADKTHCEIMGADDPARVIDDVAALHTAGAGHASFLDNVKYKEAFLQTKAGVCFVAPSFVDSAPEGLVLLVSDSPYKAYALLAQYFYPSDKPQSAVHETAVIDASAQIGAGCTIGPGVVIEAGVQIGAQCWIEPGAVIGRGVKIGAHSRIGANATISHALIGEYVRLYPGVRVGQDGFGFAIDPAGHVKVPQLGRVLIEDHVEIGANTCIDRGAGPDTVIGQGTWIDNLVQIGHNAKVGRGCVIVSQAGISGSTVLGDYVVLGGQVGIAGHLSIGSGARIAAQSGVMRDIPPGPQEYFGTPAQPLRDRMKEVAYLKRLIKNKK